MGHADTGAGAVFAADISPKCCGTHDAIDARARACGCLSDGQISTAAIRIIADDRRDRDINKDSLEVTSDDAIFDGAIFAPAVRGALLRFGLSTRRTERRYNLPA